MWPFDRMKVGLKLTLLAGIPVLGALVLSGLIIRDAQQRAQTAAALGSIEDLAQLTAHMAKVVQALQAERAYVSYEAGRRAAKATDVGEVQHATDESLAALNGFLSRRDEGQLPVKLRENLRVARGELGNLASVRAQFENGEFDVEKTIALGARVGDALIGATAALTQLTDDGKLLLGVSRLVAAMQVAERVSREHALLSYVFGRGDFPPGTYRYFVTLTTERAVYLEALRTSANHDEYERFERALEGSDGAAIKAMRQVATETTDDDLVVDSTRWYRAQKAVMSALGHIERGMEDNVRRAAATKVAETRRAVRLSTQLAVSVLVISLLIGLAIGRSMTHSVRALAETAAEVQKNADYSVRAKRTSHDELGILTDAFNAMLAGIQDRERELAAHRDNLEALVQARTRELSARNQQMRLVLDNVEQGLAMIDRGGKLGSEYSRAFAEAFGHPQAGQPFGLAIAKDPQMRQLLELAFEQLVEDILPLELAIEQMPRTLRYDAREFALSFTAVMTDGAIDGALLVTRDITAEIAARRTEAMQREQIKTFERVMRDRYGFMEFFAESRALIEKIRDSRFDGPAEKLRAIHTLKGNTAIFDVASVSVAAHDLEQALVSDNTSSGERELEALLASWDTFAARIVPVLGADLSERIEVTRSELGSIIDLVRSKTEHVVVERALVRLEREPASLRFERIAEQLTGLAKRLGKPIPNVKIESADVRLPVGAYREFWINCAHLVRNIVDHGLEFEDERAARGKPLTNTVQLRALSTEQLLKIEVVDDGRGIDWKLVARIARAKGLRHQTHADLVEALLTDGVSTAASITMTSGRGVGMSALHAACRSLDGRIEIISEAGRGTSFAFAFPPVERCHTEVLPRLSTTPVSARPPSG